MNEKLSALPTTATIPSPSRSILVSTSATWLAPEPPLETAVQRGLVQTVANRWESTMEQVRYITFISVSALAARYRLYRRQYPPRRRRHRGAPEAILPLGLPVVLLAFPQVSSLLGLGMLGLPLLYSLLHMSIGLVTATSLALRDATEPTIRFIKLIDVAIYLVRVASLALTAGWLYREVGQGIRRRRYRWLAERGRRLMATRQLCSARFVPGEGDRGHHRRTGHQQVAHQREAAGRYWTLRDIATVSLRCRCDRVIPPHWPQGSPRC